MLPAYLGWLAVAAACAGFAYLLYCRLTSDDEGSHHICQLDGYPDIHVPKGEAEGLADFINRDAADEVASMLWGVIRTVWQGCNGAYAVRVSWLRFPIVHIGMGFNPISKDHPHVEWPMPRDKMRLRLQVGMSFHLAGEIHNAYRYCLHGPQHVTKPKNDDDARRAIKVQSWIEDTYTGEQHG